MNETKSESLPGKNFIERTARVTIELTEFITKVILVMNGP